MTFNKKISFQGLVYGGLLILFAIYPIMILNVYIHEQGHIIQAEKYNISLEFKNINFIPSSNNWGHGTTIPSSEEDCLKFNNLEEKTKKEIIYNGVKFEFFFLSSLMIFFGLLFLIYDSNYKNKENEYIFWLFILLEISLIIIFTFSVYANCLSSNPKNDWHVLFFSNCSF